MNALVAPTPSFPLDRQVERVQTVMRAFYAYVLFLAFPATGTTSKAWTSGATARATLHIEVASLVPTASWHGATLAAWLVVIACSVILCIEPRFRSLRILLAGAFILATAITYDLNGKIEHGTHAAFWTAIGFCFLPSGNSGQRQRLAAAFLGVQVLVATLYTSAGICKILGTFYDAPSGITWFHPDALPYMISGNWDRSQTTLLGGFFVVHPNLSALCQCAAFVLELGALPAVFFRHLQRPWALGLIGMHVMILLTMRIHFHQSCFILFMILVASPYAPSFRSSWRALGLLGKRAPARPVAQLPRGSGTAAQRGRQRWTLLWGPAAAVGYLVVAFSHFEPARGAFRQELYPISPMAMFFRLHPSDDGKKRLAALRSKLERRGLFPGRDDRPKKSRAKRRP